MGLKEKESGKKKAKVAKKTKAAASPEQLDLPGTETSEPTVSVPVTGTDTAAVELERAMGEIADLKKEIDSQKKEITRLEKVEKDLGKEVTELSEELVQARLGIPASDQADVPESPEEIWKRLFGQIHVAEHDKPETIEREQEMYDALIGAPATLETLFLWMEKELAKFLEYTEAEEDGDPLILKELFYILPLKSGDGKQHIIKNNDVHRFLYQLKSFSEVVQNLPDSEDIDWTGITESDLSGAMLFINKTLDKILHRTRRVEEPEYVGFANA